MHLPFGQIDARAWCDRSVGFTGPHAAFAFKDEQHFFVLVKMIRRAARRDRADELRGVTTAKPAIYQHAIPAIGGRLRGTICEANER